MADLLTVAMTREAWSALLKLGEVCNDKLSAAGCNDFELPDSPGVRDLHNEIEAAQFELSVEEWRKSVHYDKPTVHRGQVFFMDWMVLEHLLAQVRAQTGLDE